MRVLVVNPPLFSSKHLSACEQDRLAHLSDLVRLGHKVLLVVRPNLFESLEETDAFYGKYGISVHYIEKKQVRFAASRFTDLAFLDGSAWAFQAPDFSAGLKAAMTDWRPDLVWVHTTYAWAAAKLARSKGFPTIVRSVNNESRHYAAEQTSWSLGNAIRALGKHLGEYRAVQYGTVTVAITPNEVALYQGMRQDAIVKLLPLRALPYLLADRPVLNDRDVLNVFFLGASYNFAHNRAALDYLYEKIIPRVRELAPNKFHFYVTGGKLPKAYAALRNGEISDVTYCDYVADLDGFLANMDIAIAPSIFGTGMQQKVFEPMCRGFPTITHARALAGYSFVGGRHIVLAETPVEFAEKLTQLYDANYRGAIASGALERSRELFGRSVMEAQLRSILEQASSGK